MKKKASDNYWTILFVLMIAILSFSLGINFPKNDQQNHTTTVNAYYDNMHYIVFHDTKGGMAVVNYTLDSIREDQAKPIIFFSK